MSVAQLQAQEFVAGFSVAAGGSWEIERLPINAVPLESTGVMGGRGYELSALVGYRIDRLLLSIRPAFLKQGTSVFRQDDDGDGGMSFRTDVYPSAILLPLRIDLNFGQQKLRPCLGLGGGFLISTEEAASTISPIPEPVLPYVEVMVGVEIALKKFTLRPELTVRNGTGALFNPGRSNANLGFGGQRWAYAALGLVVSN